MKLVLITGGSRGLGAALAAHYRAAGWRVVEFSRSGSGPDHVPLDLGDPLAAARGLEDALAPLAGTRLEEVLAIGNAAVLGPVGPVAGKPVAEVEAHVQTNVTGGIMFMAAVLAAFHRHDCPKTLVNISSGAARHVFHGWALYCASKAAMERFVEAVALEQSTQAHPFAVINISPGVIDTDMQAQIRAAGEDDFPERDRFVALRDEGALRTPGRVAGAIGRIVASRPASGGRYEVADHLD